MSRKVCLLRRPADIALVESQKRPNCRFHTHITASEAAQQHADGAIRFVDRERDFAEDLAGPETTGKGNGRRHWAVRPSGNYSVLQLVL